MRTNRDRALDAGIELLGTEGVRSLTHGRVDQRAGLPKGSTSNCFRTRAALLEGVIDALLAAETAPVGAAFAAASVEEMVDALTGLFEFLTGPQAVVTTARLSLYLEAAHDEALSAALARGRATLEEQIRPSFVALGAPDPDLAIQALATTFEGMFLHALARHAAIDARRLIDLVIRAVLPGS